MGMLYRGTGYVWVSGYQQRGTLGSTVSAYWVGSIAGSFDLFLYAFLTSWRLRVPYLDPGLMERISIRLNGRVSGYLLVMLLYPDYSSNMIEKFFFGPLPILAVNNNHCGTIASGL